jgi:hypothetical protein
MSLYPDVHHKIDGLTGDGPAGLDEPARRGAEPDDAEDPVGRPYHLIAAPVMPAMNRSRKML